MIRWEVKHQKRTQRSLERGESLSYMIADCLCLCGHMDSLHCTREDTLLSLAPFLSLSLRQTFIMTKSNSNIHFPLPNNTPCGGRGELGFKRGGGVDLDLHGERAKAYDCTESLLRNQTEREIENGIRSCGVQQDRSVLAAGMSTPWEVAGAMALVSKRTRFTLKLKLRLLTLMSIISKLSTVIGSLLLFHGATSQGMGRQLSSTEACTGDGLLAGVTPQPQEPAATSVERNRRRQMNEHLAVLRSLMPASYVQRGDQASIIGGAINFVKELEQLLQPLEPKTNEATIPNRLLHCLLQLLHLPQYSTYSLTTTPLRQQRSPWREAIRHCRRGSNNGETHANIRVLSRTRPKQLFKMVVGSTPSAYHPPLNVTTVDHMVLYSFSAKTGEDDCVLSSVNEIATAVYETVGRIQGELRLPEQNPNFFL
ncbi:Transcription factor bHLH94 [Vitis vinifera]|uniref:Transcription factor bHLH94 n=1 Tax=Vitis vinifera TaxID=29760 RepID=A0A438FC73_VITVI|nr:Transcription factor bHLH94 [Vitis vinifera]